MTIKVPAIYENGVLRLLHPLALPEHTHVQVQIQTSPALEAATEHRQAVSAALIAAGLSRETMPPTSVSEALSEERRETLAYRFAEAGPVSALIIAERGEVDA